MAGEPIVPPDSPAPLAPYSPGMRAGNVVYVSGTLALDDQGRIVGPGDVKVQTRKILESIRTVLEAAGGGLSDIVFNHIFLQDLGDFRAMNEAYSEYFTENRPARYCIRADLLMRDSLVEIASTAHID